MSGDIIIAACIGATIGFIFGLPWGVAISQTSLEEIEEEKERSEL